MHKAVLALAIIIISITTPIKFSLANTATTENYYDNGRDLNWLLDQPGQHFTLQLARSTNYDNIIKLVAKHNLQEKAIIYKSKHPKGPVYTLLYGVYSSKHDAMEVGSSLPKAVLGSKAQVRKLEAIQAELRKNRLAFIKSDKHKVQKSITPVTATPQNKTLKITTTRTHKKIKSIQPIGNAFRENWILDQKPNHYTIQLTSVSRERLANRYISHHKLNKKVAFFRTLRKKEDWYSILYGSYPTKKAALSARKKIQNDLKIKDTWVRKFADIQNAINETGSTF